MANAKKDTSEKKPTLQEIAKAEEDRIAAEREGKRPFMYTVNGSTITVWAEDKDVADKELEQQLSTEAAADEQGGTE